MSSQETSAFLCHTTTGKVLLNWNLRYVYVVTILTFREWSLHISNVQEHDRGYYMCQVNTDPMISTTGYLEVQPFQACIDDSDCAGQGTDYACFQYLCYPWKDDSSLAVKDKRKPCKSTNHCATGQECFRHPDRRNIYMGLCMEPVADCSRNGQADCNRGWIGGMTRPREKSLKSTLASELFMIQVPTVPAVTAPTAARRSISTN